MFWLFILLRVAETRVAFIDNIYVENTQQRRTEEQKLFGQLTSNLVSISAFFDQIQGQLNSIISTNSVSEVRPESTEKFFIGLSDGLEAVHEQFKLKSKEYSSFESYVIQNHLDAEELTKIIGELEKKSRLADKTPKSTNVELNRMLFEYQTEFGQKINAILSTISRPTTTTTTTTLTTKATVTTHGRRIVAALEQKHPAETKLAHEMNFEQRIDVLEKQMNKQNERIFTFMSTIEYLQNQLMAANERMSEMEANIVAGNSQLTFDMAKERKDRTAEMSDFIRLILALK